MQTFRFTGSYSINTHNSLKHKAISRFYLQLILYASFCAPYFDDSHAQSYGSFSIGAKDGKQLAQWNYSDYIYLKCWFSGDLSVGRKTGGKVEIKTDYWGSDVTVYEDVNVEILKVSDTQVWGIMWILKDNYLHYGYFVLPKAEADD